MKIANNINFHLRWCGILPIDDIDFKNHRFFHFSQVLFFSIFPGLSTCMFFLYIIVNINDFRKIMVSMYVLCGCTNALSLYLYLVLNRDNIQMLFIRIQDIVNESKCKYRETI